MYSLIKSALLFISLTLLTVTVFANNKILVLGDSLSASYGIPIEKGWVALLQQRINAEKLPFTVINASISGDTSINGLAQLPDLIEQHQPKMILIELGGNDGLRGIPITTLSKNLQAIIELAHKSKATPVLIGVHLPPNFGSDYINTFQKTYSDLATKNKIPLVVSLLTGIEENDMNFQSDGIHPVATAQPIMMENVWVVIEPILKATK